MHHEPATTISVTHLKNNLRPLLIDKAARWSCMVLGLITLLQCVFFSSTANIIAMAIINVAWYLFLSTTLKPGTFQLYPLSSFIIVGFMLTHFFLPPIITLIEGKPVIYILEFPIDVFLHSFATLLVLLTSHLVYRINKGFFLGSLRQQLFRIGLFHAPTNAQFWIMGVIGIASMFYVHIYSKVSWETTGGAFDKFVQSLIPFAYAPYLLLFGEQYGGKKNTLKKIALPLLLVTIALFANGLGRNTRSTFVLGFTAMGFCYVLGLLMGTSQLPKLTKKNLAIALCLGLLVLGPVSDLSIAMVVARGQRNDLSTADLISETLAAYTDKAQLNAYKKESTDVGTFDWNENYVDNVFLARFCNLKYNDLSLQDAYKLSNDDDAVYKFSIARVLTTLPDPVLKGLDVEVNKEIINNYSFGDYLYSRANSSEDAFANFKTGHFSGSGLAAFGWWYLLILGVSMIPIFIIHDALYMQAQNGHKYTQTQFSVCLLLSLTAVFQFMNMESVVIPAVFLIRGWFQLIFTYLLLFYVSRGISLVLSVMFSK